MTDLADLLAASLSSSSLPGGVAATSERGARRTAAVGVREVASGEPMTVETPVRIASITKPMVAAAIVLAARDQLDLPVIELLPELRDDWRISKELTLRELLSHTSGLREVVDRELVVALGDGGDALLGAARLVVGTEQVEPVGTSWSYHNGNYYVAGAALAELRGTTFEEALADLVLEPAGMTATGFDTPAGAAFGHLDGKPAPQGYSHATRPGGGLWSTVDDLMSFAEFVLADAELLATMSKPTTDPSWDRQYGLGWFLGDQMVFHPGGYGGFESMLVLVPGDHAARAIVVNQDTGEARPKVFTDVLGPI